MTIKWVSFLAGSFAGAFLAILCAGLIAIVFARPLIQWGIGRFTKRLMADRYPENIWEMVSALTRTSPRIVVENSLRASSGGVIERPFGSPRKFLDFDGLVFSPAQLATLPAPENAPVDMMITIGPLAQRPLILNIPLMAGAMGYGIGVSEKVKIAIAKGTAAVGTATNSGEGPLLPEERALAAHYILQYNSGHWSKEPETLRQADAIEIHFGQGATAGAASRIPPKYLKGRARELLQVPDGEGLVIPSRHSEIVKPQDLKPLVDRLRSLTYGIPIGVKMCASGKLEADLEAAVQAGVDFISLDGGQAGTKGGPPILEDDFGLPTIFALSRAVHYLKKRGVKDRISLLTGGGYATPGQCLKALALGADAVYMGTALLWAMTHDQVTKAIPWEPPTQLAYYTGSQKDEFQIEKAALSLENFFVSFVEEMKIAIRALGKTSLRDVNADDLVALDEWTSTVTKVRLVSQPYEIVPGASSGEAEPDAAASTPGKESAEERGTEHERQSVLSLFQTF
ncbi:FMN-binding glutamate synthase family protein [Brevibacillus thermoruber]|uniref:FMN-binding glutamate synthase family protein n=1 Tax=Brevibacillus thermoruber TaxID=33942 RepID=UPI00040356A8|nr:FMN-binding glutamate synthase family protein [Brevibacillus thermoruber]